MEWNGRRTGVLAALFLASGCAALTYEVVWFQQMGLVLGATSVTLGILLAGFMGGMGLGSWLYPQLASPVRHPLRDYAMLEGAIAVYGGLSLWIFPRLADFYAVFGRPGTSDLVFRAVVAGLLLCPPTMLMGATLPAVSRGVKSTPEGASRLGLFYGANTFGAVIGCLLTGFFVLRIADVFVATLLAMGLNIAAAIVAWRESRSISSSVLDSPVAGSIEWRPKTVLIVLVAACSGATALGAEVVWTRLLALLIGPTTYAFSMILAIFLTGLGIGSSFGAWWTRRTARPDRSLAIAQFLLLLTIPYAAWMIITVLPTWFSVRDPELTIWDRMGGDILRVTVALLPSTACWGASFPLALAALLKSSQSSETSRWVGRMSAANTSGAIIGALTISLVVHPGWGSQVAQQLMTLFAGLSAAVMAWASFSSSPDAASRPTGSLGHRIGLGAVMTITMLIATVSVPKTPAALIAHGSEVSLWNTDRAVLYAREGLDSAVAVTVSHEGYRCFHVCGRTEATNSLADSRTQRLLGHLPAAAHPSPRSVLVIGCGSGMTAGALLLHPSVERIVICEIEPAVLQANRQLFAIPNYGVLDHPKTQIVYDDARHFLATTQETFDVITTDPIHPWIRGSATLYTQEFFELCRRRLNPQGIVTQWVPLYESNRAAVKCELATLLKVFPESLVFNGHSYQSGYDLVVVGSNGDASLSLRQMVLNLLFQSPELRQSMEEIGLSNPQRLVDTFIVAGRELSDWLSTAEINRDCNLRLQYLSGTTPHSQCGKKIMDEIIETRRISALPTWPLRY